MSTYVNPLSSGHPTVFFERPSIGWHYTMRENTAILNARIYSAASGNHQNLYQILTSYFRTRDELSLILDLRGYEMENVNSLFFLFRLLKYFQNIQKNISVTWISHDSDMKELAEDFKDLYAVKVVCAAA
ncbi:MAG: DUF1987 family protein [Saprospiraceae bacterium]|nr:DUF1987 family protein [Saprospiraceae bacterium]